MSDEELQRLMAAVVDSIASSWSRRVRAGSICDCSTQPQATARFRWALVFLGATASYAKVIDAVLACATVPFSQVSRH